jgi:hypothetical protein
MHGAIPPLSLFAFMAWCSVKKKLRENFTFLFGKFNIVCNRHGEFALLKQY